MEPLMTPNMGAEIVSNLIEGNGVPVESFDPTAMDENQKKELQDMFENLGYLKWLNSQRRRRLPKRGYTKSAFSLTKKARKKARKAARTARKVTIRHIKKCDKNLIRG